MKDRRRWKTFWLMRYFIDMPRSLLLVMLSMPSSGLSVASELMIFLDYKLSLATMPLDIAGRGFNL